ncbi:MAG: hypothetical protein IT461_08005 [Planctomycetes bacterium]|jgi:hypothetical protein|nr:hypothetical protein [Planctomycetota bacterium]
MEIKPVTVLLLVALIIALIIPVFLLNVEEPDHQGGCAPLDPPANGPHPHRHSPEMERELERMRREGRDRNPPPIPENRPAENAPANSPVS